ncbi:MAG: Fumarate hydratase class II [Candidatus Nomurabacteria bacterium GW2011_GWF2_35_66]|uniref:Fumarate hydratase class II n=1 Tax=Candidatus Nomurabacteria bacterium GW2011_GWE1_35_16 TaxID=1618761 RepID=A0A0G0BBY3_9BACT|nr:MAG: Fumarate hydratase class II [Candidatus Nomurabacteria bacterium GW2011_GWF1_34_20]KKP63657.1 MAG: Fumarate hydratase class II [Candidatus Nomurabacteria bacterium GW2011_GWE2_34_25]KKP66859.1 MAG: Fumarate hydratase class II [Candidatus Nomurabacteria bacterium GW2011_GWE1_35_16]KKP83485.1 MAG: Fumarate hydratase class II [Candidatus Nomurabacteria bacterium GW2011_GWF2_35_66]HAE36583.1 aspartate ammonia-lyase [Candidatus Nomurabacteria bacterium]
MKLYYGEETKKALKNFPFSRNKTRMEFIWAITKIKKAGAVANYKAGNINREVRDAIIKACNEILKGGYESQFPLSSLQGGAGTASHTNVNEVIAGMATESLKNKVKVHPNDHVNASQSTNDVNPSALKISIYDLLKNLNLNLSSLIKSFQKKSQEFKNINKLGRTHLQDAVPTTLGQEFLVYTDNLKRHLIEIKRVEGLCLTLNLGGTAIGNSINANPVYIKEVYKELNIITGAKFTKANNLMAKTSGQTDFLIISQMITALCVDLSKIANDFKFMASGPRGGIGEIILPELQKGSTIMPGKVNPVMPETVNQMYYLVSGNNIAIEKAVAGAQMELGVMLPVIVDLLIESITMTLEVIGQFDKLCVRGLRANKENCKYHLENGMAYATLLVPYLGYDIVGEIVKKSIANNKTLREIVVGEKYLKESEFDKIIGS